MVVAIVAPPAKEMNATIVLSATGAIEASTSASFSSNFTAAAFAHRKIPPSDPLNIP
jgi:hypothetical protein